ncbi:hypothetical protein ACMHYJ_14105 [Castellaniella hirudinis]|uniref:hypothetical protein n=1 Tax=Castellaniella hirudinis TaxID=1144617 RepID=UPI0039C0778F
MPVWPALDGHHSILILIARRTQYATRSTSGAHPVMRHMSTTPTMYQRSHQATDMRIVT